MIQPWLPAVAVLLAVAVLHGYPVCRPLLLYDDFEIMARAVTWPAAWANLWVPQNEHAMPLGQLSTCALLHLAGGQTAWPRAAALQGPLALLAGLALVFAFARREFGHPFHGLVAAALFGVTAVYQQAVNWFAASFSVLALDTLLLGLLAAQAWRGSGRTYHLVLCAACCGLAPGWFASGLLAGPLCALYLALSGPGGEVTSKRPTLRALLAAAAPLVGTAAFLAVSLPRTGERILHLEHYHGRTAVQAFDPVIGALYTARSVADNLALGTCGVSFGFFPDGVNLPPAVGLPLAALFVAALVWWGRPLARPRPAALGLGLILLSYFLTYSARAEWDYERDGFSRPLWSRYHLLPQLGLALLVCAGLSRGAGRWFRLDPTGQLSRGQAGALLALTGLLLVTQLPRAILGMIPPEPEQRAALRRVEEVDALCRAQGISAATARHALGHLPIPYCHKRVDGWLLLRGSDAPREVSVDEARRLLGATP